jgi:lipoprotein-anchoring transpeptidase ErfK/SrfK
MTDELNKRLAWRNRKSAKRWIPIISVLVALLIVLFGAWVTSSNRISKANASSAPISAGVLSGKPSLTPNVSATAPKPVSATATSTLTAALSATPIPTQAPTSTPGINANVYYDDVKLYSGPGEKYDVLREVSRSDTLILTGKVRNKVWLKVETSDGQEGWLYTSYVILEDIDLDKLPYVTPVPDPIPTPVALVGIEGHWIDIDLSDQMVYAWDGTELKGSFLVSTGTNLYPTQIGKYNVYVKFPIITMDGADFYLPDVPWAMFYAGDFSIHGTYWHHNFGTPMSHGCVNMSVEDAEWLYNFSDIGTLVNIHW